MVLTVTTEVKNAAMIIKMTIALKMHATQDGKIQVAKEDFAKL
ncbi:uncharacterized protein G2W53_033264 [Senna tora]|uniref:Uncharacterized protein n=1 Tax=Senna tora TaxID=362788 RepID=A0A834SX95_9FABA|nr:uncharacterized protein G2W53_033264 [Senna tora]